MIVGVLDVLARSDDVGGADLSRLGHCAKQRDVPIGMAACADTHVADLPGAIRYETLECRYADVGGDVPRCDVDFRPGEKLEHAKACRIVDGRGIEAPPVLLGPGALPPQGGCVALDQFTQCVARRLENVVARGEAVRAAVEAAARGRPVDRRMGIDQFVRHPDGLAVHQVSPFDPEHRRIGIEAARRNARQSIDVGRSRRPANICKACEAQRQVDVFRVPGFDCFHDARSLGRGQIDPLAMEYGARPCIWAANHDDRDARPVEAGEVGHPRDAEFGCERHHVCDGIRGRSTPVSADTMGLGTRVDSPESAHVLLQSRHSARRRPQASDTPAPPHQESIVLFSLGVEFWRQHDDQ